MVCWFSAYRLQPSDATCLRNPAIFLLLLCMPNKSARDHRRIGTAGPYFEVVDRSDGSQWRRQVVFPNCLPFQSDSPEGLN